MKNSKTIYKAQRTIRKSETLTTEKTLHTFILFIHIYIYILKRFLVLIINTYNVYLCDLVDKITYFIINYVWIENMNKYYTLHCLFIKKYL